jgi:hypothetical protein
LRHILDDLVDKHHSLGHMVFLMSSMGIH